MKVLKYVLIFLGVIILLVISGILFLRFRNNSMDSSRKLELLDKKFLSDNKIFNGEILVKDLKNNKVHRVSKGENRKELNYIASVSKLYTHALIFQLIDEGVLSYNDRLSNILDESSYKGILVIDGKDCSGDITISQLINQNSGISDYELDYKVDNKNVLDRVIESDFEITFDDAVEITRSLKPVNLKENKSYYSNLNALLLGKVCEVVTGENLEDLYENRINSKLLLKNTKIADDKEEVNAVYFNDIKLNPIKYISSAPAAGGIVTTIDEQMGFIEGFYSGKLFNLSNLERSDFRSIQFFPLKYGNGMMEVEMNFLMSPIFDSPKIVGHSGSTGSFAFYVPSRDVYIVGTINQAKKNPYEYIFSYIDGIKDK